MSIKVIIPRHDEAVYNSYAGPSIRKQPVLICDIQDKPGIEFRMADKYNYGVQALIAQHQLNEKDIVVFMHEDVKVLDPLFTHKLEYIFEQKPEIGLVGCCGATLLTEAGGWHLTDNENLRGHLLQEFQGKVNHNVFGNNVGFFDDLCVVDGFCMAARAKLFTQEGIKFDREVGTVDFYDLDICLQILEKGYKIGIIDMLLQHKSEGGGILAEQWKVSRELFIAKWKQKGKSFPITLEQFKLKDFTVKEAELSLGDIEI